jgi:hypothetical protein
VMAARSTMISKTSAIQVDTRKPKLSDFDQKHIMGAACRSNLFDLRHHQSIKMRNDHGFDASSHRTKHRTQSDQLRGLVDIHEMGHGAAGHHRG